MFPFLEVQFHTFTPLHKQSEKIYQIGDLVSYLTDGAVGRCQGWPDGVESALWGVEFLKKQGAWGRLWTALRDGRLLEVSLHCSGLVGDVVHRSSS